MLIRPMQPSDIDFAFACTRAEGWAGETREVFTDFLAYDPKGCLIAELDGQPVGMCVATSYSNSGFIGELIVLKEMRRRGYGRRLLEQAIKYLRQHRIENIYLDGDLAAIPIYEKMGFRKVCRSLRFYGTIPGKSHPQVRPIQPADLPAIAELDRELFGADRSFFLERRLVNHPDLCLLAERDGQLLGYLLARPGNDLLSAGPWAVLEGLEHPETLLESLTLQIPGQKLRLGVLEANRKAVALLSSLPGFSQGQPSWRMALGPSGRLGLDPRLFAIGSAAKG